MHKSAAEQVVLLRVKEGSAFIRFKKKTYDLHDKFYGSPSSLLACKPRSHAVPSTFHDPYGKHEHSLRRLTRNTLCKSSKAGGVTLVI
jgi:hypothetical protein